MVTFLEIWLTTLTTTLSPSLATKRGPGNFPFTLRMVLVWHNLVTFRYSILTHEKAKKYKKIRRDEQMKMQIVERSKLSEA